MSAETAVMGLMASRFTKPDIILGQNLDLRHLPAIRIGWGVPRRHFDGRIHSIFERVCNLELTGGELIALAGQDIPDAPRTIRIYLPDSVAFSAIGWPGRSVACRAGVLRLDGAGPAFDLRPAADWAEVLPTARNADDLVSIDRAWRRLRAIAKAAPQSGVLAAWNGLEDCVAPQAFAGETLSRCVAGLACLIGLGPGLTPAGDDFVTGFLAGLYLFSERSATAAEILAAVTGHIDAWSMRTTDVSRWMLLDAASGRFAEPVVELSLALMDGGSAHDRLETAAAGLLALGHLSGIAMIYGLLSGIATAGCPGEYRSHIDEVVLP